MKQEEKRPYGAPVPGETYPNCCCVCGKMEVFTIVAAPMGQIYGGLCEEHKDAAFTLSFGGGGIFNETEMKVEMPSKDLEK